MNTIYKKKSLTNKYFMLYCILIASVRLNTLVVVIVVIGVGIVI